MLRFAAGVFGRLLFLVPALWIAGMAGFALTRCPGLGVKQCIWMVGMSPLSAVLPDIAHDEEPPVALPYLAIACIAIAAAVAWEYGSSRRRRRY